MSTTVQPTAEVLSLEQSGDDTFMGRSSTSTLPKLFGGQVTAQAMLAAGRTVGAGRDIHSIHSYFLRPASVTDVIEYRVTRLRESRSFSTRQVMAHQNGKLIFNLTASFHVQEEGFAHQVPMPEVPRPSDIRASEPVDPELVARWKAEWPTWQMKPVPVGSYTPEHPTAVPMWFRLHEDLPDDQLTHSCALAYSSDMTLLGSTIVLHGLPAAGHGLQASSLDHVMWFHRKFRVDEWMLHYQSSTVSADGRGLNHSQIFTEDGRLVSHVAQEGLFRDPLQRHLTVVDDLL
jgi:acyl-CoA thioesterase-2